MTKDQFAKRIEQDLEWAAKQMVRFNPKLKPEDYYYWQGCHQVLKSTLNMFKELQCTESMDTQK